MADVGDAYKEFINARLAEGADAESIRAQFEALLLPLEELCAYCPRKATRLCDYVLGFEQKGERVWPDGYRQRLVSIHESEMFTCDMRLCDDCAERECRNPLFACGKEGYIITERDVCKEHTKEKEAMKERLQVKEMVILRVDEAVAVRTKLHMKVIANHPLLKIG